MESLPNLETPLKGEIKILLTKETSTISIDARLKVEIVKVDNAVFVQAIDGDSNVNVNLGGFPFAFKVSFSNEDVIAQTTTDQNNAILNVNLLSLLTKIKSNADLNKVLADYEKNKGNTIYPTAGNYTISIQNASLGSGDWPFKTSDKQVLNGISIELPIK